MHESVLARARGHIARVGWSITGVFDNDGDPPFAYTAGLTALGRPELVMSGLDIVVMGNLLNTVAAWSRDQAATPLHSTVVPDLLGGGYEAVLISGEWHEQLHPGVAFDLYGKDAVRAQQVVWPDEDRRWPWQPGYSHDTAPQRLLITAEELP